MKELWQGSVEQQIDTNETAPGLIWLWWISWIVSSASGFGEEFTSLDVIAFAAAAVSAGALYVIVERITAAQPTMSVTKTFK
ncbi:hypothetical protein FIU90_12675 [Erythrobacter sp. THAF29]|nr:hypothetical protein FIU90_12675 [Erythrobacter sp. THAF29]